MNNEYLIQTAIMLRTALEAVEAQLAQQRVAELPAVQQLVLEDPAPPKARKVRTTVAAANARLAWHPAEEQKLKTLFGYGMGDIQIGEMIGRSPESVRKQRQRLGLMRAV